MTAAVHIYAPRAAYRFVRFGVCLDCGRRSAFAGLGYEWHGSEQTCMRCGRRWSDGEWMPLNFERQARTRSIDRARMSWKRCGAGSLGQFIERCADRQPPPRHRRLH